MGVRFLAESLKRDAGRQRFKCIRMTFKFWKPENHENKNWIDQKFCLTMPVSSLKVIIKMPVPVHPGYPEPKVGFEACRCFGRSKGQIESRWEEDRTEWRGSGLDCELISILSGYIPCFTGRKWKKTWLDLSGAESAPLDQSGIKRRFCKGRW